jgi:AmmeMemoRadiSam system protein B
VAGRFYPRRPDELSRDLHRYMPDAEAVRISALGCISPHAGYMFSGHVAGAVYSRLEIPKHCVILCPNHTGIGVPLAVMTGSAWQTPLGSVTADTELGRDLLRRFPSLQEDSTAHRSEHAIEVQLPFLQARRGDLSFVPIAVGTSKFEVLQGLGEALADAILGQEEKVLIIASSDMNHYESDAVTRVKDHKAIARVLALDPRGLWEVVINDDVSMCGFGPAIAMLTAAKRMGATSAELVRYATSGDISGDREQVVGYAGIIVK